MVNDAYNANPDSTRAAIEALAHLTGNGASRRGFAVLGYMAELGDIADDSHAEAGRLAALAGAAVVVAVGGDAAPRARRRALRRAAGGARPSRRPTRRARSRNCRTGCARGTSY